jgi:hypothetical protein
MNETLYRDKGYDDYSAFCDQLDDLSGFKSHERYVGILEHVGQLHGYQYLSEIFDTELFKSGKLTKEMIKNFCIENDKIGDPNKFDFDFVEASPTNFRYILHAILSLEQMAKSNCTKIVEVGGGYGGLCLMISKIIEMYDFKIEEYNIIDLTEICKLQVKYLSNHNLNFIFNSVDSVTFGQNITSNDLFLISNYCLGEISKELVDKYSEKLFPKVSSGFMVWNFNPIFPSVSEKFNLVIETEKPLTHWSNKYLYF